MKKLLAAILVCVCTTPAQADGCSSSPTMP